MFFLSGNFSSLVIHERFKRHILCFELDAVGKYKDLERVFEAARDESYFQLAGKRMERRTSETLFIQLQICVQVG